MGERRRKKEEMAARKRDKDSLYLLPSSMLPTEMPGTTPSTNPRQSLRSPRDKPKAMLKVSQRRKAKEGVVLDTDQTDIAAVVGPACPASVPVATSIIVCRELPYLTAKAL